MPSPGIGRAGRIRVYNIGIGAAAVIPQGVHIEGLEGLPTHEALHSKAWDIWLKLEANAKKAAKTPAFVVSAQVGVDANQRE